MGNIFIAMFVALFSFQAFTLSYQISTFRKTIVNIPISLIEKTLDVKKNPNSTYSILINTVLLEEELNNYLYLKNTIQSFSVNLTKYNFYGEELLPTKNDLCESVIINASTKIMYVYDISESMQYTVQRNY